MEPPSGGPAINRDSALAGRLRHAENNGAADGASGTNATTWRRTRRGCDSEKHNFGPSMWRP
eukprot:1258736-Lingulodinium_polyedra.AAC.1